MNPRKTLTFLLILVALLSVLALLYPFLSNPTSLTEAYISMGSLAPFLFILLVVIAPTPGSIVGVTGISYFGFWLGALLLFLGNLLGVTLTFALVRHFGRPAATRFVKHEKIVKGDAFLRKNSFLRWLVYAVPIFPLELMTFVIALSNISFRRFFLTAITALPLYALFVAYIGDKLADNYRSVIEYTSLAVMLVMLFAIAVFLYKWKKEEIHETGRRIKRGVNAGFYHVEKHVTHHVRKLKNVTKRQKEK